jgi:acyl-coenzyme A synthetase/AMP-(fatty) acid ligase
VIVRNGYKVPAAEVESALSSHPGVSAVAVVADPDAELGERVVAVVVARGERRPWPSCATTCAGSAYRRSTGPIGSTSSRRCR